MNAKTINKAHKLNHSIMIINCKKKGHRQKYNFVFIISFLVSLLITIWVINMFINDPLKFDNTIVKSCVIAFLVGSIALLFIDIVFISDKKGLGWYYRLTLAIITSVIIPPIMYDIYIPPFTVLILAVMISIALTLTSFTLYPIKKHIAIIYTIFSSLVPFLTPVLFYILYQIIQMPHIIEIAGVCHVSNIKAIEAKRHIKRNKLIMKIQEYIWTERIRLLQKYILKEVCD